MLEGNYNCYGTDLNMLEAIHTYYNTDLNMFESTHNWYTILVKWVEPSTTILVFKYPCPFDYTAVAGSGKVGPVNRLTTPVGWQ